MLLNTKVKRWDGACIYVRPGPITAFPLCSSVSCAHAKASSSIGYESCWYAAALSIVDFAQMEEQSLTLGPPCAAVPQPGAQRQPADQPVALRQQVGVLQGGCLAGSPALAQPTLWRHGFPRCRQYPWPTWQALTQPCRHPAVRCIAIK